MSTPNPLPSITDKDLGITQELRLKAEAKDQKAIIAIADKYLDYLTAQFTNGTLNILNDKFYVEFREWTKKAADAGSTLHCFEFGRIVAGIFWTPTGASVNYDVALEYFKKGEIAATGKSLKENKGLSAQNFQAPIEEVTKLQEDELKSLISAAYSGDVNALSKVTQYYHNHRQDPKIRKQYNEWLPFAAEKNDMFALYVIGRYHADGSQQQNGIPQDLNLATTELTAALNLCLNDVKNKQILLRDIITFAINQKLSIEQHTYKNAIVAVANLYYETLLNHNRAGTLDKLDAQFYKEFHAWTKMAADQGSPQHCYNWGKLQAGIMVGEHLDIKPNPEDAIKYFVKGMKALNNAYPNIQKDQMIGELSIRKFEEKINSLKPEIGNFAPPPTHDRTFSIPPDLLQHAQKENREAIIAVALRYYDHFQSFHKIPNRLDTEFYKEYIAWIQQAAKLGSPKACYSWAKIVAGEEEGIGQNKAFTDALVGMRVRRNFTEALSLLRLGQVAAMNGRLPKEIDFNNMIQTVETKQAVMVAHQQSSPAKSGGTELRAKGVIDQSGSGVPKTPSPPQSPSPKGGRQQ